MPRENQPVSVESACVPNISQRGRRRRLGMGGLSAGVTAAVAALLVVRHAPPLGYLVLAPLTFFTALYFFQVKEKT
jgi:hypothetical protein